MITADQIAPFAGDLAALADSWLVCGAAQFSIWSEGQLVRRWPASECDAPASISAPIEIGARAIGQLRVAAAAGYERFQGKLNAEARLVARIIGQDQDLEQMTGELVEMQDQLLALYDLSQAMRSQLSIGETMRSLAGEAARLVRAEGAALLLHPMLVQHPQPLVDELALLQYFQRVQSSGRELMLNNASAALPPGLHNFCLIPIRIRGTIGAGLGLINKAGGFTAPALKLARAIAEHAGAQLEHALLYQEQLEQARMQAQMEVARKVQMQMLPQQRPHTAGLDVFAEAHSSLQVGGDFFDFVEQPDRPLFLMVGDVSGKGVPAALIMGMIRVITNRAARFLPRPEPAVVLARANEDLYEDFTRLDTFATVFVAAYEPANRTLQYANAGHAPVIYRPAGGCAALLEADGVPVGVLPVSLCENQAMQFGIGDVLVVATDGFSEAGNPDGELFGYDRLLKLIDQAADQPAQVIAQALFDAIADFSAGRPQDDDQTIIVIKGVECSEDY